MFSLHEMKMFKVFTEKEHIFFLFYCLHANARFWRHNKFTNKTWTSCHRRSVLNMWSAGETKTKCFGKSKLSCYQNVPYSLTKKTHINTWLFSSETKKLEVIKKTEVGVLTSAFQTMKKTEVIQGEEWKYKSYQSLVKWYDIISLVIDTTFIS